MTTQSTYKVNQGNETHILNVLRGEHGSLVYQMWTERNGVKAPNTWTTKQRLDKETKQFFKL